MSLNSFQDFSRLWTRQVLHGKDEVFLNKTGTYLGPWESISHGQKVGKNVRQKKVWRNYLQPNWVDHRPLTLVCWLTWTEGWTPAGGPPTNIDFPHTLEDLFSGYIHTSFALKPLLEKHGKSFGYVSRVLSLPDKFQKINHTKIIERLQLY